MRVNMLKSTVALAASLLIAGAPSAFAAGSEADFKTAYAAAEAANKEAASLRNQWTTTAAALAAAKKAADAGDFDKADRVVEGSRSAGQGLDLPGHRAKKTPGKRSKYTSARLRGGEISHDHPPPGFSHACGRRRALAGAAAPGAQRRQCRAFTTSNVSAMRASCT